MTKQPMITTAPIFIVLGAHEVERYSEETIDIPEGGELVTYVSAFAVLEADRRRRGDALRFFQSLHGLIRDSLEELAAPEGNKENVQKALKRGLLAIQMAAVRSAT